MKDLRFLEYSQEQIERANLSEELKISIRKLQLRGNEFNQKYSLEKNKNLAGELRGW